MHADLILISHASTAAIRGALFPADDALDAPGMAGAEAAMPGVPHHDRALCAPSVAARQSAAALGLDAAVDDGLRDYDFGRWAGRPLAEVAQSESEAFGVWRSDPTSRAHGGESMNDLLRRVGMWLDECRQTPGRTVAVTHPAVVRAAIIEAIEANPATFWRVDVEPLSQTWLRSNGARWTLRGLYTR